MAVFCIVENVGEGFLFPHLELGPGVESSATMVSLSGARGAQFLICCFEIFSVSAFTLS